VLTVAVLPRSLDAVYITLLADAENETPGERVG
jgi:hypothetical protein